MHITIDPAKGNGATFLPCCACGWRGIPGATRGEAIREAARHERRAHPGEYDTTRLLGDHRRRRA